MKNNNIFLNVGTKYLIRQEFNGITVHNSVTHIYFFYEGLSIEKVKNCVVPLTEIEFEKWIVDYEDRKTQNINSIYPFYLGWEVSGKCNLNCIYCFAENAIHTENTAKIMDTVDNILKIHPMVVGLSGGEPTLNSYLPEIIRSFYGNSHLILNTNGTTKLLSKVVPELKRANVLVRLTVDALDNDVLNRIRPPYKMPPNGFDQVSIITENIKNLVNENVNLLIHTVLTNYNKNYLEETAKKLISLGVKRWHFYPVNKCDKCKDFYDEIYVTIPEIKKICGDLISKYGNKLHITYPTSELNNRDCAVLLIDSTGRFFVNPRTGRPIFIGKNPKSPTIEEVNDCLNYKIHKQCYISNFWGIS